MIEMAIYLKSKFFNKKILVRVSDIHQVQGKLIAVSEDHLRLQMYKKTTPIIIPTRNILLIEEVEEG